MNKLRISLFSVLILVLLLSTSVAYASSGASGLRGANLTHCNFASTEYALVGEFSAEDVFESATLASLEEAKTLAICLDYLALPERTGSFSGDDAYDPAAGGLG